MGARNSSEGVANRMCNLDFWPQKEAEEVLVLVLVLVDVAQFGKRRQCQPGRPGSKSTFLEFCGEARSPICSSTSGSAILINMDPPDGQYAIHEAAREGRSMSTAWSLYSRASY